MDVAPNAHLPVAALLLYLGSLFPESHLVLVVIEICLFSDIHPGLTWNHDTLNNSILSALICGPKVGVYLRNVIVVWLLVQFDACVKLVKHAFVLSGEVDISWFQHKHLLLGAVSWILYSIKFESLLLGDGIKLGALLLDLLLGVGFEVEGLVHNRVINLHGTIGLCQYRVGFGAIASVFLALPFIHAIHDLVSLTAGDDLDVGLLRLISISLVVL